MRYCCRTGALRDHPALDLYRDSWVIIAWSGNSEIGDALTMEQLAELPWIVSSYRPAAFGRVTRQLAAVGIEPRIDLVVDNYLSLPLLVAGTDRLALIQERRAHRLAGGRQLEASQS